MKTAEEKYLPLILLGIISCTMVVLTIISEGYSGGADNINHYFLSRYAFHYHMLFFDSWGRPFYTILSSPFAQISFLSVKLLNVFFGMCTAYLAFLIAKRLEIKPSWLVMIFVVFAPVYCMMLPTSLTEILFGMMLVLGVYLFFRENYLASAIIISFLPFARSEGIIMIPVFVLAYLLKRKFKPIPLLLTGFVVLSLIGGYFYKDLLWIIHYPPYPIHHPIYKDKGPLFHFFNNHHFIFGTPLLILFLTGTVWLLFHFIKDKFSFKTQTFFVILLILVPFAGYFIFHSMLYWKALGGSIGLIRVIAAVFPLAAIVALMGYQWIVQIFFKHPWQRAGFIIVTSIAVIMTCFKIYPYPVKLSPEEALIKSATNWVKAAGLSHKKIIFNDLNVPFYMDLDPYNGAVCAQKWFVNHKDPAPQMPDSAVFIWDSHFGPNECQVPLDSLMMNPHYLLINRFLPPGELKTYGGNNYEVYVFLRLPQGMTADNAAQLDLLIKAEEGNLKIIYSNKIDFEDPDAAKDTIHYTGKTTFSGSYAYKVAANKEFSPGPEISCAELHGIKENLRVKISFAVFPEVSFKDNQTSLVISVEKDKKSYQYISFPLAEKAPVLQQWNPVNVTVSIPEIRSSSDRIMIYLWHQGKHEFIMDEMKTEILVQK
jgi:hypothetical protein